MLALVLSLMAHADEPVDPKYTWDLSAIYPSIEAWEADVAQARVDVDGLPSCAGTLGKPAALADCAERFDRVALRLARIGSYANNWSAGDVTDAEWRARAQTGTLLWSSFAEATSWVEPELVALGPKKIEAAIKKEPRLAPFAYGLRATLRHGEHTLSPAEEALLASAVPLLAGPYDLHTVLLTAELPWPELTLDDGSTVTLDTSTYARYRASSSRAERERVFAAYFGALEAFQGTAGAALSSAAQGHWFTAKARGYDTSVAAALDAEFLPEAIYRQLVTSTNANLPTLHRYLKLRARMLGVTDLAYSDLYPPLVDVDRDFTIEQAEALAIASAAPLGTVYTDILEKGFAERWMDVYPRPAKDAGAYMDDAAYDVHPFVLTNFNGDYLSVSTVAHEWGHAAHSALTQSTQPHATAQYATFVAEVASTFAEALLLDHMLKQARTDDERLLYLGAALETLRTTYFRQAMFAEFELKLHEHVEKGEPVTGEGLTADYLDLLRRYYGADAGVTRIDDLDGVEWVFVPHFYYDFYVWQYATSIAAASLLSESVLKGEPGAVDRYLTLLRSGGSDDATVLLKTAGVDMTSPAPYDAIATRMEAIMDEIEAILDRRPATP